MKTITETDFDTEVLQAELPVFVDFGADWCAPCKRMEPILKKVASDYGDRVKIVKVNAEDDQPLATRYRVRGLPAIVVFKSGEPVEWKNGFQSESELVKLVEKHA